MPPKVLRGERLRHEREKLGFSQSELGRRIGTGENQINRYELGLADPNPYTLTRLAKELQITTDYLLGLVDRKNEHLTEPELTPEERQFLAALREGKVRTLLRLIDQAIPDEQEQADVPGVDVAADGDQLDTVKRPVPR
jgi:transcriptional regulator with XRE-family HTH domain